MNEAAVPAQQPVLPEHPFDRRDPAHHQDHQQRQVHADQPGEAAEEGNRAAGSAELGAGLIGDRQRGHRPEAGAGEHQAGPGEPRARTMRLGAGRLALPALPRSRYHHRIEAHGRQHSQWKLAGR